MTATGSALQRATHARLVQAALAAFALTLIATAIIVPWHLRLAQSSGLRGEYRALGSATEAFDAVDATLTESSIRSHTSHFASKALSVVWTGYLIAPTRGTYRIWVPLCVQQLTVDRHVAGSDTMSSGGPPIELARGLHAIEIHLTCGDVPPEFHLEWARGEATFRTIADLLLIPALRERGDVQTREWLARADAVLPIAWLCATVMLVAAIGWVAMRRRVPRTERPRDRAAFATLIATAAVVFIVGIWWGVPSIGSWAADEVFPTDINYIVAARFAHGWATIYPPLHYAVLALAFTPFRLAQAAGLSNLDDTMTVSRLLVVSRLVSVAMALGTVITVFRIGADLFGRNAGVLGAAVFAFSLPTTYYSKTANLDLPYVFWLMLSLCFFLRAAAADRRADYYWFALTATAAVCTKDQVYGFYVLPAAYIGLGTLLPERRRRALAAIPAHRILVGMIAIAAIAFVLFHNLLFNFSGFREHLRLMTQLEGFRMVQRTPGGLLTLTATAVVQIANGVTWPLLIAAAFGIAFALRTAPRLTSLLLMPAVSYHLFFICVVLYHYDRFFLGVIAILAVFSGVCLDRLIQVSVRFRAGGVAVAAILLLNALVRCVALDLLMVRDSRYDAERWLRAHVEPQEHVAAVGFSSYLPRSIVVPWTFQTPSLDRLAADRPDVVLVNRDFDRRSVPASEDGRFYAALADGSAGYDAAAEFRTTLHWPLDLDLTFGEDPNKGYSNLTKINPPIVIYVRRPAEPKGSGAQAR